MASARKADAEPAVSGCNPYPRRRTMWPLKMAFRGCQRAVYHLSATHQKAVHHPFKNCPPTCVCLPPIPPGAAQQCAAARRWLAAHWAALKRTTVARGSTQGPRRIEVVSVMAMMIVGVLCL